MDGAAFNKTFKTKLLTGLFITFPLVLTLLAVKWLFLFLDGILGDQLDDILGVHIWGLGLGLSVLLVFSVGALATTVLGKHYLDVMERTMMRLPVVKSFYNTFKQLGDAFSPDNKAAFKKFVIVEYPRAGVHSFGFLTKECSIRNGGGEPEFYYTVYIPTNHVYLGDIAMFKKEEVTVTDLTIEDGLRILLSAGIAAPSVIERSRNYADMEEHHVAVVTKAPETGETAP
ncbi:MAG: DUF502 domain-containing protein [Nitrospirae bacterium]|nr:DUF502 domain-containing protein [Nitrospirota bacterium]